jgi:putative restriction endonuclease
MNQSILTDISCELYKEMGLDWRNAVFDAIQRLCRRKGVKVFSRQDLIDEELNRIVEEVHSVGITPAQTLSRVLQELRDEGAIEFLDNEGTYRLL